MSDGKSEGGSPRQSTHDKLLLAAIDLISQKGYKGVTTQEIATAAEVTEKTLFRHFGSKLNLLETAFDRFHYTEEMTKLFKERIIWDLQADLTLITQTYHDMMNRNRKMIMISIKEGDHLEGFRAKTMKPPRQLVEFLTRYFHTMFEQGKLIKVNAEIQAFAFITMHYGAFLNHLDSGANFPSVSLEDFIVESVKTFTRALTP